MYLKPDIGSEKNELIQLSGCIKCVRCSLLLPMSAVSVCQSVRQSAVSLSVTRSHAVQPLPNDFGLLLNYTITSLTYIQNSKKNFLYNLISVQPPRNTRSSSVITITRPPARSFLKITNRCFKYALQDPVSEINFLIIFASFLKLRLFSYIH